MGDQVISMPLPSVDNTEKLTITHTETAIHSLSCFDANDVVFDYSVDVARDIIINDALYSNQFHHTELSP
jgi:hypothetical protein